MGLINFIINKMYSLNEEYHEIIDNLYLGNRLAAQNLHLLNSLNINHILICGNWLEPYHQKANKVSISYKVSL